MGFSSHVKISIKISGNVELFSKACFPFEVTAKFANVGRAFSENSLMQENLSSVGTTPLEIKVSAFSKMVEMLNKVAKQNVLVLGMDSELLSTVKRYETTGSVEARNNWVFARQDSENKSSGNSWLDESIFVKWGLFLFGSFDKIPSSTISVLFLKKCIDREIESKLTNCRIGVTEQLQSNITHVTELVKSRFHELVSCW